MHCAGCAAALEKAVKNLPGVSDVYVNFASGRLSFFSEPDEPSDEKVLEVIRKTGFNGSLPTPEMQVEKETPWYREFSGFFIALFFTVLLLMVCFGNIPSDFRLNSCLQIVFLLPVLIAGRGFFLRGIPALFRLTPNMDSLISCGSLAGIVYSLILIAVSSDAHLYFDASAMIITLIMLGKTLESRSRKKASSALKKLLELTPPAAHLVCGGSEIDIPCSELTAGDVVRIRPGERIPADSIVKDGCSFVNESMFTGEESPVGKSPGEKIFGGTINIDGSMLAEVTASGEKSLLGQIVSLISQAQNTRPPAAKLADKVAGGFVWCIFGVAILTALFWGIFGTGVQALHFSLSVLVMACPCSLGLAVPIALICGIGRGAQSGILIKNGTVLENAAKLKQIVFDKTGTLTVGVPEVKSVSPAAGITENELLQNIAEIEYFSTHPLALAISAECEKRNLSLKMNSCGFQTISGRGVSGMINNRQWLIGNRELMLENLVDLGDYSENSSGLTAIFVAVDGEFAGIVEIGGSLRAEAPEVIEKLKRLGLKSFMLTGDNQAAAEFAASKLPLAGFRAGLFPAEKVKSLEELRESGGLTAMVGDGINDAPVLAASDLGIAIGSGSDIALESADAVLLHSDLREVVKLINLSRKTFLIIRQNLFWAFFYNICGIPLAAGGWYLLTGMMLNPAFCAGAMAASSVTVVINALRLQHLNLD